MNRAWAAAAAALCCVPLSFPSAHAAYGDDLLFEAIGQRWLDRNPAEATVTWPALLEQRFAHLALGVFDVHLPTSALADAKALREASASMLALLDTQRGWGDWVSGAPTEDEALQPIRAWLEGLNPKSFGKRDAAGADLAELAEANEAIRAELEHYRSTQRAGQAIGVERKIEGVSLVVFPRRAEFVEFVCVLGMLDERLKPTAWNAGLTTWLEYRGDSTRFLTLEYATSTSARDVGKGVSVGARNPTALQQLVCQVGCRAMLSSLFSDELDPALRSGLGNALVIDLYGELDTRVDGDVRSRSSQGSSVFVPGGNPSGGILPATSAENRWRGTKGKDHFVGILSKIQKQSGKKAKSKREKLSRFELISDGGARKEVVSAPFLGPNAVKPSDDVWPDYLELVRCYGVAFLHWLRVEGATDGAAATRYGEFLRALGRGVKTQDLPQLLQEVYAQPLSAGSAEELFASPTLEGRFLTWLSKR